MAEAVRRLSLALVPATLLAVFAFFCGTFDAVSSTAAIVRAVCLLGMAGLAVFAVRPRARKEAWTDALGLGRAGRWLPLSIYGVALASCWASPVPRAGWTVLLLLPAFYLLPAAVAWCWRTEQARRWGLPAVTAVVIAVAVVSLVGMARGDLRAAEPLGQHILLAAFLVTLWPLALVGVFQLEASAPSWIVAGAAALLGVATTAAIVKSGSLLSVLAFVLQVLVAWTWRSQGGQPSASRSRSRWLSALVVVALVGGALALYFGPRLLDVASLEDNSLRARLGYWQAGLRGLEARPMLGWGPGSTPWTLAEHLRPDPGVRPAGEVVGDLHGLPQQLAYELGVPGLLLVLGIGVAWWLRRRYEEGRRVGQVNEVDGLLARCSRLGVLGFAICSLGSGVLMAPALPVGLLVLWGAGLSVNRAAAREHQVEVPAGFRPGVGGAVLASVVGLCAVLQIPLLRAQWHYDTALASPADEARRGHLSRAVELDPRFPLYRARLAQLEEKPEVAARQALRAATDAHAVAPLWLLAGQAAVNVDIEQAQAALLQALDLAPLSAPAPWLLLQLDPRPRNAEMGARAVLAEPNLAGARWWAEHPRLWSYVREAVRTWPGLDPGWVAAFLEATASLEWQSEGPELRLDVDAQGSAGGSALLFRRTPSTWVVWTVGLGEVPQGL